MAHIIRYGATSTEAELISSAVLGADADLADADLADADIADADLVVLEELLVAAIRQDLNIDCLAVGHFAKFGRTADVNTRFKTSINNSTNDTYSAVVAARTGVFIELVTVAVPNHLQIVKKAENKLNKHEWDHLRMSDNGGGKQCVAGSTTLYFFYSETKPVQVDKNALIRLCSRCKEECLRDNLKVCCRRAYCSKCAKLKIHTTSNQCDKCHIGFCDDGECQVSGCVKNTEDIDRLEGAGDYDSRQYHEDYEDELHEYGDYNSELDEDELDEDEQDEYGDYNSELDE
jgi:hypothetical protein